MIPKVIGTVTVTTAGTPVQLTASDIRCSIIKVQSTYDNTGRILIENAAEELLHTLSAAGEFYEFVATRRLGKLSINKFYVDAAVSGEKVDVVYYP